MKFVVKRPIPKWKEKIIGDRMQKRSVGSNSPQKFWTIPLHNLLAGIQTEKST